MFGAVYLTNYNTGLLAWFCHF